MMLDEGAVPGAQHATPEPFGAIRTSHILVFNPRKEILMRRTGASGMPHGGVWTTALVGDVAPGDGYGPAAAEVARSTLGLRPSALRFVGHTWLDRHGERAFIGVFVAAHDGPAPHADMAFVPLATVLRASRTAPAQLSPEFLRAFRLIEGDW